MNEGETFSWSAPEYEERDRSPDWFWALGVIIITGALTSIIFSNYFFAVFLLLSGGLVWFFSQKAPEWVNYELTAKGLKIKNRLYPYENIKSFWVPMEDKPLLFVRTERFFIPAFSMPIEGEDREIIKGIFLDHGVIEEEMKEHPSEKLMDTLGF